MYIEKIQLKGRTLDEAILRFKLELESKMTAVDEFPIKLVDGEKYINIGGEWFGMLEEVAVSATGIGKKFNEVRSALAGTGAVYEVLKALKSWKIKGKRRHEITENVAYEHFNKITKNLNLLGFSSIAAYEKTIRDFQNLVKKKAHRFVDNYFYIYEDSLAKEENKLTNEIYVNQLYARLINSEASKYHEGNSISLEFNKRGTEQGEKRRLKQFKEREAKKKIGKEAIDSLGLFLTKSPKFDYDELSKVASKEEMVAALKTEISNQYVYIQDSREYITEGDTVFEFPEIIQQVLKKEGIGAGSVLYTIVMDKINDVARNQILHGVAIAVFAIAVGLLTAGAGTMAVLGATTVAAAGIYVTTQDIKKYQGNSALHAIGLTDKEPSIVWVIISIVGTALDAAALIKLVKLGRGLGKTVDAIDFEKQVLAMQELTGAMKANIIKQARLDKELKLAMNSLRGKAFMMAGGLDPQVFVAMRAAIKKGLVNFDQFLLELKAQKLIRSMEDLSPEQVKSLKEAFKDGLESIKVSKVLTDENVVKEVKILFKKFFNNNEGKAARATKNLTVESGGKKMAERLLRRDYVDSKGYKDLVANLKLKGDNQVEKVTQAFNNADELTKKGYKNIFFERSTKEFGYDADVGAIAIVSSNSKDVYIQLKYVVSNKKITKRLIEGYKELIGAPKNSIKQIELKLPNMRYKDYKGIKETTFTEVVSDLNSEYGKMNVKVIFADNTIKIY
ncbi:hypothetical protein [Tenacibaculum ovolyticum]|uniref:hypothetical protein n=1 Tax=Tenacibaculum ovolyticum TaxID=104270 RepID=UPI00048C5C84|nr:hypothetical protein [Tenacibaculum ovolyticum]